MYEKVINGQISVGGAAENVFKNVVINWSAEDSDPWTTEAKIWMLGENKIALHMDGDDSRINGVLMCGSKSFHADWDPKMKNWRVDLTDAAKNANIYAYIDAEEVFDPYKNANRAGWTVSWVRFKASYMNEITDATFTNGKDAEKFAELLRKNGYENVTINQN